MEMLKDKDAIVQLKAILKTDGQKFEDIEREHEEEIKTLEALEPRLAALSEITTPVKFEFNEGLEPTLPLLPTASLSQLAVNALSQVTVKISGPTNMPGSTWNQAETAWFYVELQNIILPLRDVAAELVVTGAAAVKPISGFTGKAAWKTIEPQKKVGFWVPVYAAQTGQVNMTVRLSAEVVPYATVNFPRPSITVT